MELILRFVTDLDLARAAVVTCDGGARAMSPGHCRFSVDRSPTRHAMIAFLVFLHGRVLKKER